MTDSIEGQVAVVTGGGRGIGFSIAETLAQAGASVAIVARSTLELNDAASVIQRHGTKTLALSADVTDRAQVETIVGRIEQTLGAVTLLINNAGTPGPVGPDWAVDVEDWWRCIEVSVRGAFVCTQAVLPRMLSRGSGRIINIASLTGLGPRPFLTGTSVAKTALIRFSEGLAAETNAQGISVFAIHPGAVRTNLTDSYLQAQDSAKWVPALHQAPEDFWSSPEAAGHLCARLATGLYDRLTGRFLTITDNLDELVERVDEIEQNDLYVLRLQT